MMVMKNKMWRMLTAPPRRLEGERLESFMVVFLRYTCRVSPAETSGGGQQRPRAQTASIPSISIT